MALVVPLVAIADPALEDQELDSITAGGQPVVVAAGSNSTVIFAPDTEIAMTIEPSSQAGLRALVLNNVTGENQIANGINVRSVGAGNQNNAFTQSWGSIQETTAISVAPVIVAVEPSCNGALICKSVGAVAALPGTVRALANTGDQIVTGGSSVFYAPQTTIGMKIETNSQTNLVALIVNNVSGMNQVGNAVNVQGNGVGLTGDGLVVGAGAASQAGGQYNAISQYRGTPANFTR